MTARFDWLIVGAGLSGATMAERIASELDQKVLVIDRRDHIAGNVHDYVDDRGLLLQAYGPHAFHTVSSTVWEYLSRFTEWRPYDHRVLGLVDGRLVPVPFNLTSLRALLPAQVGDLEELLIAEVGYGNSIPVLRLMKHEQPLLAELGRYVYEKVFERYSSKQWGVRPEELDRSVTGRVPVLVSEDDRYFRDQYQAIPARGYTAMVQHMLDHPNITVELGTSLSSAQGSMSYDRMIYTGSLDELFGYQFGPLPYRSLRFETSYFDEELVQPVGQVNYPDDRPWTRTLEHKHLTGQRHAQTAVTTEFPQAHQAGETEPYYPIPAQWSRARFDNYKALADKAGPELLVLGRLADYRYYNMDQAVNRALHIFERDILGHPVAVPI